MNKNETQPVVDELMREIEERTTQIEKERAVKKYRTDQAYNRVKEAQDELDKFKTLDVTEIKDDYVDKMDKEHDMMLESFNKRLPLVTKELTEKIPFSYPNLIFIGARSGMGKSTFAANTVYKLMKEGKKVLVISNEEMGVNVYNRVICLDKGWNVNNITNFTSDQHAELKKFRAALYRSGRINVIDNSFSGYKNATTTLEGIKFILNNLKEKYVKTGKADYDAILIDYFQKINESKVMIGAKDWEVLGKLSEFLDTYYKDFPAPIVVFGQLKNDKEEGGDDFEYRIKGGKSIHVVSTVCLELAPDKQKKCTDVKVHKNRWGSESDVTIPLGWEKGLFVAYTPEFQLKMSIANNEAQDAAVLNIIKKDDI